MAEKILHKVAYNGIDKENWTENRDSLIQRIRPERSTFLNINELQKSGRKVQEEWEKSVEWEKLEKEEKKERLSELRKFVELENINY